MTIIKEEEIEKYVQQWMDSHEPGTFIKDPSGSYMYRSGAVSLNLKVFFEHLLQDFAESKLKEVMKERLIAFKEWYDKLSPSDKVSVWSEDGSAKGLFNMSDKQIVDKFLERK